MLDYALFAESDRMGHLLGVVDQKKLDLQRGVVQNEKRQGENQPYGVAYQLLTENTYPAGHPYSWTVIGSMKDLDAASMADVQEWFKTNYGPNNTTLVLAGDITPEAARQKVEKYFGDIPAGPPLAKHEAWIAKRTGTHRSTVQDRVPQARLYRVWNVPGAHTASEPLLDLAAHVLGGGKTSRFYKRLVYKDQLATSATASNDSSEIAGQFDLTLTARPGVDLRKLEMAADEELRALMKTRPDRGRTGAGQDRDPGALHPHRRARRRLRRQERPAGFVPTYTGNPDCYKDYLKAIKAATPAQVKQAMNEWLERRRLRARSAAVPDRAGDHRQAGPQQGAGDGQAGIAEPAADAEDDLVERPEGGAGRTPCGADRQFLDDGRQRLRVRFGRAAGRGQPVDAHAGAKARRPAAR